MACYITRIKGNLKTNRIRNRMVRLLILRVLKKLKKKKNSLSTVFSRQLQRYGNVDGVNENKFIKNTRTYYSRKKLDTNDYGIIIKKKIVQILYLLYNTVFYVHSLANRCRRFVTKSFVTHWTYMNRGFQRFLPVFTVPRGRQSFGNTVVLQCKWRRVECYRRQWHDSLKTISTGVIPLFLV